MASVDDFDPAIYRLGRLCKREHDWRGSGQTLRYRSSYSCVACAGTRLPGPDRIRLSTKVECACVACGKTFMDFPSRSNRCCCSKACAYEARKRHSYMQATARVRRCAACGEEKPTEAFRSRKDRRSGTYGTCRLCESEAHRQKRLDAGERTHRQRLRDRVEEFWSRVDKSGPCWVWTSTRFSQGYGVFSVNSKPVKAHRLAWELTHGSIPVGRWVLHHCDNPACVRPDHLFLGDAADNNADARHKGRARLRQNALLTDAEALTLLRLAAGGVPVAALGAQFGVGRSTVWGLINGRTYRHLPR